MKMILSYMVTVTMVPMAAEEMTNAGGILKLSVSFKSVAAACLTKSVGPCAMEIPLVNAVSQMGIRFRMSFVSSTFVTVDSLQGFSVCST